jgi:chromosome segregation protein
MLTRLELIGFKSFADKTRFDFAPGITAVVGPNGSGKSNIVDAVKWVLGEQSAKSLRGGEMADVIFNGSSSRKSLGMAEVSLTFDNRPRLMGEITRRPLDSAADEVQIARRVYRDGQGEYLINGQLGRLKDIKELFLGSGAGHGAYSVIEQGRVDALLTASTADRRVIFEEAAGISRFKARKIETLRKLEHVDADLTRVRDVLHELDKQLRSLRLQAAKAQRYQQHMARLKELRVGLGLSEFRDLTDTLVREGQVLVKLQAEVAGVAEKEQAGEERLRQLDAAAAAATTELRGYEAELNEAKQAIAAHEAVARSDREIQQWEADRLRLGKQSVELDIRLRRISSELAQAISDGTEAERLVANEQARVDAATVALSAITDRITTLTKQSQIDRDRQFELSRTTTRLSTEVENLRREAQRQKRELDSKLAEWERVTRNHDALAAVLDDLVRTGADVQEKLNRAKRNLAEHLTYRDDLRRKAENLQADLDSLRESRSALRGRADVLDGLEQSHEGLGAGVRAVLARLSTGEPAMASVAGLVADLLSAPREVAPFIDLALGDAAQRFVVTEPSKLDEVVVALTDLPGRVGFIPLSSRTQSGRDGVELAHPVAGAPDSSYASFVSVANPTLAALPHQLLGNVFLVPDLAAARELSRENPSARFVTRNGELLEPDGTLTVGPIVGSTGILSRKSELRELKEQIARYDERIGELESEQAAYRRQAAAMDAPVQALETEIATRSGEAGDLQTRIRDQSKYRDQLAELKDVTHTEVKLLETDLRNLETELANRHAVWGQSERTEQELKEQLARAEVELAAAEREREQRQDENTAARIALSRVTTQLAGLQTKRTEWERELDSRRRDAANLAASERSAQSRLTDCQLLVLRATAAAAEAYSQKGKAEAAVVVLSADVARLNGERDRVRAEVKAFRDAWAKQRDRAHAHEMLVHDLTHRRDTLVARIRDDYGVELAELAASAGTQDDPIPLLPAHTDLEAVQEEIDELKAKIAKLGSVNLEAVDELAELEQRENDLRTQHDDLTSSQAKLIEIINQINVDSRRLFVETLTTVRGHFQELFRKLFGGGMADVVLEDESDPLESGIEVTARPPGKELRSISLLSGGERTLTAVALLLAIFRSRPSPFCLLDEVDAALDEANTARLAAVLREFLDRSQFIIVTHKKRTMAMADIIFGITMQESGVSKQVSVRFEDWPEDEPSAAA